MLPCEWRSGSESDERLFRYHALWRTTVLLLAVFCLLPLIVMTVVNYSQYERAMKHEMTQPIYRYTSNVKRVIGFLLEERRFALDFIVREKHLEELSSQDKLARLLMNLKKSFGGFVDIGVIDRDGRQISYAGPYELLGKNYADQDWFHEVNLRGVYVSDMFTGYRKFPHFVIAVKCENDHNSFYALRATIDMEILYQRIRSMPLTPSSDAFLINEEGVLQTPSQFYGEVMEKCPLPVPPRSDSTDVREGTDPQNRNLIVAYSYIEESPFIFMVISDATVMAHSWFELRRDLLVFLIVSSIVILLLIVATSTYMVSRVRDADQKRAQIYHEMEYTNKMASIGRLAAGVAHEINNPLAIINEKAGLLKDLLGFTEDFHHKERIGKFADSITSSVERCRTITHRLLGFAKHMDLQMETLNLTRLIEEVLGFLDKEAEFRELAVSIQAPDDLPPIDSDRGQLQQVFLNIINNAFAAVEDKGTIDIRLSVEENGFILTTISDNGCGIPQESLRHIFEPFFTTKKQFGTGLGLSITYGIVQKLGGRIEVKSEIGKGTDFYVYLPLHKNQS